MIEFRPVKDWTESDFAVLVRWENDPTMKHLIIPRCSEAELPPFTLKTAKLDNNPNRWMIFVERRPVGQCSVQMDHPATESAGPVAWVSLVLGERDVWGKGIADKALDHMISFARNSGAKLMEAGVFAFNERSLRFWKRHGFGEFLCIPRFTFWNGKWWPDIRLKRPL